jgi:hypothetical protein
MVQLRVAGYLCGLGEIGSWYGGLRESSTSNIIRTLAAALPEQRTLRRRIAQIEKCLETQGNR